MNDERIVIEWGAVANGGPDRGFLPRLWINGRGEGSTWAPQGYSRNEARALAQARAQAEAERFAGDWDTTVQERGQQ